jgi:hypothetical protein
VNDPGDDDGRSAFRAFVREHHPDRGGDPGAFVAGLRRFGTGPDGPAATAPGSRSNGTSGTSGTTPADAPRAPAAPRAAPPVDMAALPFPVRVGVALIRTWRRRGDPPDPPPRP